MSTSTTTYPYNTIVYITDVIGGVTYQASGVLISPDEVLTASHVVYSAGVGTATDIEVSAGYESGATPYGTVAGVSFHYNPVDDADDEISNAASQSDFAVIHLAQPLSNVGTMSLEAGFTGGAVTVSGYPASADGTQVDQSENVSEDPGYTLFEGPPLGDGSSGGPVWVRGANGQAEVVGLVSSGNYRRGYFVQLTSADIAQIDGWVAADDGTTTTPSSPVVATTLAATLLGQISAAINAGSVVAETAAPGAALPVVPAGEVGELLVSQSQNVLVPASYGAVVDSASGASTVSLTSGSNVSVVAAGGALELVTGATSGTLAGGAGGTVFFAAPNAGAWDVALTGGANTISAIGSSETIAAGSGHNEMFISGAADSVASTGSDTIVALGGAATISATNNNALIFGVGAAMTFLAGSGSSTVVGGTAGATLFGGSGAMLFFGLGSASYQGAGAADTLIGGTGSLTAQGGSGAVEIFGGAAGHNRLSSSGGQATLIGGGAGDVLTASGAGSAFLIAGSGQETLNGASSTGNDIFIGGSGADVMQGGAGNDTLLAGSGNATLGGGAGDDAFVFNGGAAASAYVITNFHSSGDVILLTGLSNNAVATVYQTQTETSAGTQITLPGGATITLTGIFHLNSSSLF